jgi:hypothetical protein
MVTVLMSDAESAEAPAPRFRIALPGGRVARVPLEILEQYVDPAAVVAHGSDKATDAPQNGGEHHVHVHVHVHTDGSERAADDDVVAHSLSVDAATGSSDFHTDWEQGECDYTDESGFPQRIIAWHRHPFGTEYSEIFEG